MEHEVAEVWFLLLFIDSPAYSSHSDTLSKHCMNTVPK
jgi:hypothetical protein